MVRIVILLARSIILARLLPVELFGIYAGAATIVVISAVLFNFGLGGAYLYIRNQDVGEDPAAAVHFTLNLILKVAWVLCMLIIAAVFLKGATGFTLVVLTLANFILMLTATPQIILAGRVVHRRLALIEMTTDIVGSLSAILLAYVGYGLWALMATNIVAGLMNITFLYFYQPVWVPHFSFAKDLVRRFIDLGWHNVWAEMLQVLLNKLDDLWTVTFLGAYSMGLYSRAYAFALYPRKILATPVNSVSLGLYAELASDRYKLSQAFFRINALLIRAGFLLASILALIAPEIIHLVIGDKWLPFLGAFRLMLLFSMLDPIKTTTGFLFVAVGKPEVIVRIRLIQLALLAAGLLTLGNWLGIEGVALAVDIMLLVGIALLLWRAREFVDISVRRLFQAPLIALVIAGILVYWALVLPAAAHSYWHSALIKLLVFVPVYSGILLLQEWRDIKKMLLVLKIER